MKVTKWGKMTNLEREIDSVLTAMSGVKPETKEYTAIATNLAKLYEAKGNDKKKGVSADTIAVVLGNLLGLIVIMNYEKANILTTKALGFIMKGRV